MGIVENLTAQASVTSLTTLWLFDLPLRAKNKQFTSGMHLNGMHLNEVTSIAQKGSVSQIECSGAVSDQ